MAADCMNNLKSKKSKYIFFVSFIIVCIISIIYTYIGFTKPKVITTSKSSKKIILPIIMYHNISKKASLVNQYCVLEKNFEKDLKYIKSHGYNCISTEELIDYVYNKKKLPENPFMITFDDGYESFYEYAYPLLKKYDMKAVMSIVGSYTDLFTTTKDHNIDYSHLTWKQVNELNNTDFIEIQNHTYNMHEITSKRKGAGKAKGESFEQFKNVLKKDTEKLNNLILNYTGKKCTMFTYPYGNIAEKSVDILKEIGFLGAFTCTEQVNIIEKNPNILYSLCRFNRNGKLSSEQFFKKIEKNIMQYKNDIL